MKILIISDTHGRHGNLEAVIEKEQPFDMMIHLGDVEGGEDYIQALVDCEVKMIAGNNDFYTRLPQECEFEVEGLRIFMTHGHQYSVHRGVDRLAQVAREKGADIVMFGHIHMPVLETNVDTMVLCPGSISCPRQMGRRPSYVVMNLKKGMQPECEIVYL